MGLTPVAADRVAAIVTHLEMRERPRPRPVAVVPFRLIDWPRPSLDQYRGLFRRVGAPWLWFSRLILDDAGLAATIHDPRVKVHAVVDRAGLEVGLLELDFRAVGQCEIAYFGLVSELSGKGIGRWLMSETMVRAWQPGVTRVWVHTCTLDHPSAMGFYRKQGFTAFRREVETFPDPRLSGILPRDAAPQIPLIDPRAS